MEFRGCKYAVFDGLFWDQRPSSLARTMALNSEIACCTLPSSHTRSEEHTSELQSLMRSSYAVFCLTTKPKDTHREAQVQHIEHVTHVQIAEVEDNRRLGTALDTQNGQE